MMPIQNNEQFINTCSTKNNLISIRVSSNLSPFLHLSDLLKSDEIPVAGREEEREQTQKHSLRNTKITDREPTIISVVIYGGRRSRFKLGGEVFLISVETAPKPNHTLLSACSLALIQTS